MLWADFVQRVQDELATGALGYLSLHEPFSKERELTKSVVRGLRDLFVNSYGPSPGSSSIHHHMIARQGDDLEDRAAWTAAVRDKWILLMV